jgi:hypothetical protein
MKILKIGSSTVASVAILAAGLLLAGLMSGCSQTVESSPNVAERISGEAPAPPPGAGFMGADYSLLKPGKEGQAALVYINPNAQWSKYNKIMLEPVEFWDSSDSKISPSDQQMLTGYFYNKLKEDLQKNFTLVDQGGPGVMTIQAALTGASTATPVLRSVSVVIPQARILNSVQSLATGSYAFVGSASAAGKIRDSQTGELLAASMDERKGGMALSSAAQWQWGDAENAMNYWSEKITNRLLELQGRAPANK